MYIVVLHEFTVSQGRCFNNQIMKHWFAMYGIEQSDYHCHTICVAMHIVNDLNHTMMGLLTSLSKEQKDN